MIEEILPLRGGLELSELEPGRVLVVDVFGRRRGEPGAGLLRHPARERDAELSTETDEGREGRASERSSAGGSVRPQKELSSLSSA